MLLEPAAGDAEQARASRRLVLVSWTAEWLAHYELWKRTHPWYGDGDGADTEAPTAAPRPLGEAVAGHTKRRRETHPRIAVLTESLAPFLSPP